MPPGLKYQFFHACPTYTDNNSVWNPETEKWRCTSCLNTFTDEDCTGQCGTCGYNEGPCLPGGTSDEMQGCMCRNIEIRKQEQFAEEATAGVYRIEVVDKDPCEHWIRGDETEKKYLGSNSEKRVNIVRVGPGHWENMKKLGYKWDYVHIVMMERNGTNPVTFHKFYKEKPTDLQLDAIKETVVAAGKVVHRSALERLR